MNNSQKCPSKFSSIDLLLAPSPPKRKRVRPPSPKPSRGFLINQILGVLSTVLPSTSAATRQQQQSGSGKNTEDYVKKLGHTVEHCKKFNNLKSKSHFSIVNVPADPEQLLAGVISNQIFKNLNYLLFYNFFSNIMLTFRHFSTLY